MIRKCPKCGASIKEGEQGCKVCGLILEPEEQAPAEEKPRPRTEKYPTEATVLALGIVSILLSVGALGFCVYLGLCLFVLQPNPLGDALIPVLTGDLALGLVGSILGRLALGRNREREEATGEYSPRAGAGAQMGRVGRLLGFLVCALALILYFVQAILARF